tara:strand:+ start:338 stop:502 length:165 start_codon:yes stop_codon:yes gene_type:complete
VTEEKRNQKQEGYEVKTFSGPFALGGIKENITISTNTSFDFGYSLFKLLIVIFL